MQIISRQQVKYLMNNVEALRGDLPDGWKITIEEDEDNWIDMTLGTGSVDRPQSYSFMTYESANGFLMGVRDTIKLMKGSNNEK